MRIAQDAGADQVVRHRGAPRIMGRFRVAMLAQRRGTHRPVAVDSKLSHQTIVNIMEFSETNHVESETIHNCNS